MSRNLTDALLRIHRDALMAQLLDVSQEPEEAIRQVRTINALVYYLSEIGVPPSLTQPLVTTSAGIADRLQHTNLKPLSVSQPLAACAAAVDLLKEQGVPVKDALRDVAKEAGNGLTGATLEEFRKNLHKGRARLDAQNFYHSCVVNNRKTFEALEPAQRRAAILRSIRSIAGKS